MQDWAKQFYNSEAWRACRRAFLESKGGLCERCSSPDNPVLAKVAHHKIYLTKNNINNPEISLSWSNLEALCQDCHNKEHHRTDRLRYRFDAAGNLILPPVCETSKRVEHRGQSNGFTPRGCARGV